MITAGSIQQPGATPANEYRWSQRLDAWWRAANYLSVGQIYLLDNPLLREPLQPRHVKPRLLGHWGTVPGLTLTYAHLSRMIMLKKLDGHAQEAGRSGPCQLPTRPGEIAVDCRLCPTDPRHRPRSRTRLLRRSHQALSRTGRQRTRSLSRRSRRCRGTPTLSDF